MPIVRLFQHHQGENYGPIYVGANELEKGAFIHNMGLKMR